MSNREPDPQLQGAGLSATGRTADQFQPGEPGPGTTYGDPGGTGTADREVTGQRAQAGQRSDGQPADGVDEGVDEDVADDAGDDAGDQIADDAAAGGQPAARRVADGTAGQADPS